MAIGLQKVTPTIVKRWRDALIFLFAGSLPFSALFTGIFHITTETFALVIGFLILIVTFGAKLFGLDDGAAVAQLQEKIDDIKDKAAAKTNP